MVSLSAYAAVQAKMEQPIAFPGDFVACDGEFCQSTGILNAYLKEWVALTPAVANEAFNVQGGLPFTWGRL